VIERCCMCAGAFDTKIRSSRARTCSEPCAEKLSYLTRRKAQLRWAERHPRRKQRFAREYSERNRESIRKRARENATKRRRAKGIKPRKRRPPEERKQKRYQYIHCVICSKEIIRSKRKHARKTCSPACSETLYQKTLTKGREERAKRRVSVCVGCGRAFHPPHRLGTKYCSKKCSNEVRRADEVRREKQRLRSARQKRRLGVPVRPPTMTPEQRKEAKKLSSLKYRRSIGVKPQKRLTDEERLQRHQQKVARQKIKQKEMYATDPIFRAKRKAASRDYRLRMIQADPTWVAKNNAAHRERERIRIAEQIANPQGEEQWLLKSRHELHKVKKLLSGGIPQKVSGSPRKASTPLSNSPP
jgi:predicted nucleic acid-binding Zn ribbon protein